MLTVMPIQNRSAPQEPVATKDITPPGLHNHRKSRVTALLLMLLLALGGEPAYATSDSDQTRLRDTETVSPVSALGLQMRFPVAEPVTVRRRFDRPERAWSAGHRGVDFTVAAASPVRAPGAGEVTFVGTIVDRGVVVVLHDNGLRSSFEPVVSTLSPGQRVTAGGEVGRVSSPDDGLAHCGPDCLHWGVRQGEVYLDPLKLVRGEPSVLLPQRP